RVDNVAAMNEIIIDTLAGDDAAAWVGKFESAGVPCSPINSIPDLMREPQVEHRGMVRNIDHPVAGAVPQVVSPMRFRNAPLEFERAPPLLSEHTEEVLRGLGFDDDKIDELRRTKVI
ncbi:MAG: CoA transferase, partial [Gammaproteobacteria bacterium]|nr:CoA transferase [Gammaproteobacteria bacterium]